MPYLNVRVVDEEDRPISGERVRIFISHAILPQTWLEDYTDEAGLAYFDFESGLACDVYVRGDMQMSEVGVDGEVTVSV